MKEYITKEASDQIFNANTANGCREMEEDRFNQAANEVVEQIVQKIIDLIEETAVEEELKGWNHTARTLEDLKQKIEGKIYL